MSDLINREDAIKAVCRDCLREYEEDNCEYENECSMKKALVELPSAEAKDRHYIKIYADDEPSVKAEKLYQICGETRNKEVAEWLKEYFPPADTEWIPVSEQLPSEYGEYLATVDGETIDVTYVPETKGLIKGWSTCDGYGYKGLSDNDVIAWKPKPKPYKESEAEE